MSEADDVLRSVDQLRRDLSGYHGQLKAHNDLQRHCENQRKRIGELEGLYAKAKAENAKLRELVADMWHEGAFEPGACYAKAVGRLEERTRELGVEVDE